MYRLVWGWERREWRAIYEDGKTVVRRIPKYPQNRFHLEVWMPAEKYGSREQWAKHTHRRIDGEVVETLGPYPAAGEYEHLWQVQGEQGEFIHPTENMMLRAIRQHKKAVNMDRVERLSSLAKLDAEQEASRDSENRTATRELAKEFVEKSLEGRTVRQLKEELTAPKERKSWHASRR